MPDLLKFEWFRDTAGYECAQVKTAEELERYAPQESWRPILRMFWGISDRVGDNRYIVPKGGSRLRYDPLDQFPGAFREFAENGATPADAVQFASRFGPLGLEKKLVGRALFDLEILQIEPFWEWVKVQNEIRDAVESWERGRERGNLDQTISLFSTMSLPARVRLTKTHDASRPALYLEPPTLCDAMWLQFAQSVSADIQFKRCAECPTWFPYGTGTGRRRSAFYCSERCRKAAHKRQSTAVS